MIEILIADDHAILRKGLIEIISAEPDMHVCCEAKNADEVLSLAGKYKNINMIILDINMPGRSGLDILEHLKILRPEAPVLVLSINPEEQFAKRSLRLGAAGYLNKDVEPEEFLLAIRKVAKGQKYISNTMAVKMFFELEQPRNLGSLSEKLSNREYEVLRLIVEGKTGSEIAKILSLSPKTISTYKIRIMKKFNAGSTQELINYVKKHNLV